MAAVASPGSWWGAWPNRCCARRTFQSSCGKRPFLRPRRAAAGGARRPFMINDTLTVVDHRTGKSYELPIEHGAIRSTDLRQIRTGPDDFGLLAYDPAFMNTAACNSRITFIDGDRGILEYRGYPIEQ